MKKILLVSASAAFLAAVVVSAGRPTAAWVTDITYIRTYEGWLYLAVVLDLFSTSRRPEMTVEAVENAPQTPRFPQASTATAAHLHETTTPKEHDRGG